MLTSRILCTFAVRSLVVASLLPFAVHAQSQPAATAAAKVPLYFEENRGQTESPVKFTARSQTYTAWLTGDGAVLQYHSGRPGKNTREDVLRMSLAGSKQPQRIVGADRLPGIVNYFIGNDPSKWHSDVPTYGEVDYTSVYPGIDLAYRGSGQLMEFDFRVAPGADPGMIRMDYTGASAVHVDTKGDLVLDLQRGHARFVKPTVYQTIGQERVAVAANYLVSKGEVTFQLGAYDHSRALVIDPVIGPSVYYATYVGSGLLEYDYFNAMVVDSSGNAYLTGETYANNFPIAATTGTPYDGTFPPVYLANGQSQAAGFVTVVNAAGTGLIYSTFISGNGDYNTNSNINTGTTLNSIAIDPSGQVFVGGACDDSTFPTLKAFQGTFPANANPPFLYTAGIVFGLTANGNSLIYSSFIGAGWEDSINKIAVDASDNVYITGASIVDSGSPSVDPFPVTAGTVWGQIKNMLQQGSGFQVAFASKIAPPTTGNSKLTWSTQIGGPYAGNSGNGIAVDASGNVYVAGVSTSDVANGASIAKEFQMTNAQTVAAWRSTWVVKLNSTGTTCLYRDYLGGNAPNTHFPNTVVSGIAVDSTGQVYVAGVTYANNFEMTSNAYHSSPTLAGGVNSLGTQGDAYLAILSADGSSLVYSTFVPTGSLRSALAAHFTQQQTPMVVGPVLGPNNEITVAGITPNVNFPIQIPTTPVPSPLTGTFPSTAEFMGFITKFDGSNLTAGAGVLYSTYVGGAKGVTAAGQVSTPLGNTESGSGPAIALASNGSDVFFTYTDLTNGMATGQAYDGNNSTLGKQTLVRVQDAPPAITTTLTLNPVTLSPSTSAQNVTMTSTLTPSTGTINSGVVTYTVTGPSPSTATVGTPVTTGVVTGNLPPAVTYVLPANAASGTYTMTASYNQQFGLLDSIGTNTLTVSQPPATISATITSVPAGLTFSVSGTGCAAATGLVAPQTLQWTPSSTCTVTFATPQAGATGTQYVLSQWEDSSTNATRLITAPSSATTYTATFATQYLLTTQASPVAGGSVSPATAYENSGTVNVSETPNACYAFSGWGGATVNSGQISLAAPTTLTANFVGNQSLTVTKGTITTIHVPLPVSYKQTVQVTNTTGSTADVSFILSNFGAGVALAATSPSATGQTTACSGTAGLNYYTVSSVPANSTGSVTFYFTAPGAASVTYTATAVAGPAPR